MSGASKRAGSSETEPARKYGGSTARGRFAKGNPGRPRGALNRATLAAQALLDGEVDALTRKAIELAKAGDTTALKLCMDRLLPPRRGRPVQLGLPSITTAGDLVSALGATIKEMASGSISPEEAATIAGVLETKRRVIETAELEARLVRLEQQAEG